MVLKRIVHQIWIYDIFFVFHQKKHFLWKVNLDKINLKLNKWENRMLKVSSTEDCYIGMLHYISRTDFEHHFSQLFRVKVVLSRWTFHRKYFFFWDTKKFFIQNWWAIPLNNVLFVHLMNYLTEKNVLRFDRNYIKCEVKTF